MVTALQAKKKPVLSMAVRIGGGRSDTLLVYPGDDPKYLAFKFCETHSLPLPRTAELVEAHIRQELALSRRGVRTVTTDDRLSERLSTVEVLTPPKPPPPDSRAWPIDDELSPRSPVSPPPPPPPSMASSVLNGNASQSTTSPDLRPVPVVDSKEMANLPPLPTAGSSTVDLNNSRRSVVRISAVSTGGQSVAGHPVIAEAHRPADADVLAHFLKWRPRLARKQQLQLCLNAMQIHSIYERELASRDAEIKSQEAIISKHELEISELHAANSRIATLAFSQAGVSEESAKAQLEEILIARRLSIDRANAVQPHPRTSSSKQDTEARFSKLLAMHARATMRTREQELLVHCWAGWRSLSAERSEQRQAARAEEKRANEQTWKQMEGELDRIRDELYRKSAELDELTAMLINAKLREAELNDKVLTLNLEAVNGHGPRAVSTNANAPAREIANGIKRLSSIEMQKAATQCCGVNKRIV